MCGQPYPTPFGSLSHIMLTHVFSPSCSLLTFIAHAAGLEIVGARQSTSACIRACREIELVDCRQAHQDRPVQLFRSLISRHSTKRACRTLY